MNDAIGSVRKILKLIIQREKWVFDVLVKDDKELTIENYDKIVDITARIINMIHRLADDNHNMRRPFIFNR